MQAGDVVILKRKDGSCKFFYGKAPLFLVEAVEGDKAILRRFRSGVGVHCGAPYGVLLRVPCWRVDVRAKDETMKYRLQVLENPFSK